MGKRHMRINGMKEKNKKKKNEIAWEKNQEKRERINNDKITREKNHKRNKRINRKREKGEMRNAGRDETVRG